MYESFDDIMQRMTIPELLDAVRSLLDEVEAKVDEIELRLMEEA